MLPPQISNFLKKADKGEDFEWIVKVHYEMLRRFGWIPYDEFLSLPLPVFCNLLEMMKREVDAEMMNQRKMEKRYGRIG